MPSAFGVEHVVVSKKKVEPRDYSVARAKWEKHEKQANIVENTGGSVAAAGGLTIGAATLRDAGFKDHPNWKLSAIRGARKLPKPLGYHLVKTKPGFKAMSVVGAGTVVGYAGNRHRRLAEKKVARYTPAPTPPPPRKRTTTTTVKRTTVSKSEPGALMHAHDQQVVSKLMSDAELSHRKKTAAVTGVVASTLGVSALAAKGGGALIPRVGGAIGKTPKARKYAKQLDQAATSLAIGGSGVAGVGGFNMAAIHNDESKRQQAPAAPVAPKPKKKMPFGKAFDSERARLKRLEPEQKAATGVAVGAGAAALSPFGVVTTVKEHRKAKIAHANARHEGYNNSMAAVKEVQGANAELDAGEKLSGAQKSASTKKAFRRGNQSLPALKDSLHDALAPKPKLKVHGMKLKTRGKLGALSVAAGGTAYGINRARKNPDSSVHSYKGRYGLGH